jgi:hypothetical protein
MAIYVQQIECLHCSNCRSFIQHTDGGQRRISQEDARLLGRRATLSCGRCGSTSLILGWTDYFAHLPTNPAPRRRRRRGAMAAATPVAQH